MLMLIRVTPQASEAGARANLKRLVEERADSYSQLSMLVQRPPEYLGRYVRQGTPKRLRDSECELLGRYFQVPPQAFGKGLD